MVTVCPSAVCLLLFLISRISAFSKFDNEIIGLPKVSCERDNIRVKVQTGRPFEGRFFVKGEFHSNGCGRSYANGRPIAEGPGTIERGDIDVGDQTLPTEKGIWNGNGHVFPARSRPGLNRIIKVGTSSEGGKGSSLFPPQQSSCPSVEEICPPCECGSLPRQRREANWVELVVPLGACNAKRDRVMNPPSLVTSFVAIVSFHGSFITKMDRAYHIKCAFNESSFHVDTELNVTMKDSANLSGESRPPVCEYRLLGIDGSSLRQVKVGDLVRHEWSCEGPANSRVLVHDCYAEDGHGTRQQVVDAHGCSIDQYAIPTPQYDHRALTAFVDAYVFQFPDQASVSFQCSIRSCSGVDENCREMSPPNCDASRRKRSTPLGQEAMTIHSPTLTVLDLDRTSASPAALTLPPPEPFCLSLTTFGAAVSLTTFLVTTSVGGILFQYFYVRSL